MWVLEEPVAFRGHICHLASAVPVFFLFSYLHFGNLDHAARNWDLEFSQGIGHRETFSLLKLDRVRGRQIDRAQYVLLKRLYLVFLKF